MKDSGIIDLFMISVMLNSIPSKNTAKYDKTFPAGLYKDLLIQKLKKFEKNPTFEANISHDKSQFFIYFFIFEG